MACYPLIPYLPARRADREAAPAPADRRRMLLVGLMTLAACYAAVWVTAACLLQALRHGGGI